MLRCKYCGAPFERAAVESDSPIVTCSSCGTSQQRIDAKAYLDQMMGQVRSWISSAIPSGFSMAQAENVDPVARHSIFMNNVRPKVEMETTEYRFAFNSLLAYPMIALPFTINTDCHPAHTSDKAFEFNAKVRSVEGLAVDGDSKDMINTAAGITQAYAMTINNLKLLAEDKPGRYILMANNFTEAGNVMKKVKGYDLACQRFEALVQVCNGTESLLNGDTIGCVTKVETGIKGLEAVKANAFSSPELGIMFQAVDLELSTANILHDMADMAARGGPDAMKVLNTIRAVIERKPSGSGQWGYLLNSKSRFTEIFAQLATVIAAKGGIGTVKTTAGGGDVLIPFWDIDLKYSFVTGALWKKKSVEVTEDLFVPADFVIDQGCLGDPSSAVTDIFKIRPETSILAGISGSETSISGGEGITALSGTIADNSIGGRSVAIPLSTKREAEKLMDLYLAQRTSSDNKLKLSKPRVKGLVFIPCRFQGDSVSLPEQFGKLVPARCIRMTKGDLLII
jgi:hypothetical protein